MEKNLKQKEFDDNIRVKNKKKPYITKNNYPDVSHINSESFFIYDQTHALIHFKNLTNKNLLKIPEKDLNILRKDIDEINKIKYIDQKNSFVEIPYNYARQLEKLNNIDLSNNNEISQFLLETIKNTNNRENISCRKLSKLYETKTGKKISKSTIHMILRKRLDYRYLKTNYKTKKIQSNNNKIHSFFFIKALIKCIKLNFEFIFLDESKIELINNHLKCWRKKDELILFGDIPKQKTNLILAIGKSNIFNYKITSENTNTNNFLEFIKEIKIKIDSNNEKKYVIICDNCSSHKSEEIINFFNENKLRVIFTPPYMSIFTPIELAFRAIKNITYKKMYSKIDEVIKDITNFLTAEEIKKTLLYNYKETLGHYISFMEKYRNENLNSYIINE